MSILKKISIVLIFALAIIIPIIAFDWPQNDITLNKFSHFFGQKRSSVISNSLIFSESENAFSTDEGQVTVILMEHEDGFNWFESTLGTFTVVAHEDSLLTVYGNLDSDNLNYKLFENPVVHTGTKFSTTGNSAWQETESFLEFQIIDTKNSNYVNPLILMPRIGQEEPLTLTNIKLVNKFGKIYDLENQKNIPAGVYKIYRDRQTKAIPYKTSIFVNGTETEKITFDTIKENNSKLAVEGRNLYTASELYPDENTMLIGELYLPHGKDTVALIVTDFSGKERSRVFNLTVF